MSKPNPGAADPVRAHDDVLGYLLKHAHLALEQRTDAALAGMGLTARDLGVLRVIAGGEARSQQEVATVLGVDRTSMVALLDALEHRGIVARRPSERDRRRNAVELTQDGRSLFQRAEQRSTQAELAFTAVLGDAGRAELRRALKAALDASTRSQADPGDAAELAGTPSSSPEGSPPSPRSAVTSHEQRPPA
jgi:DNA-binding MarR family transcriptional regulator